MVGSTAVSSWWLSYWLGQGSGVSLRAYNQVPLASKRARTSLCVCVCARVCARVCVFYSPDKFHQ